MPNPPIVRAVAQLGSAPVWGTGGRRFKSCLPDHLDRGFPGTRGRLPRSQRLARSVGSILRRMVVGGRVDIRPLIFVLLTFASGCAGVKEQKAAAPPSVQTVVADEGAIQPTTRLAGFVAPYQNVAIQSTLTEPADLVNVQEGDRVRQGEVLAQLDTADLKAALDSYVATADSDKASTIKSSTRATSIAQGVNALDQAQASLRQAQANLQRDGLTSADTRRSSSKASSPSSNIRRRSSPSRTISRRFVKRWPGSQRANQRPDERRSHHLRPASGDRPAGKGTEKSRWRRPSKSACMIAKARIVSPIDGVVVNRNINPGEYPGTRQIFTLQQVDPVYAILRGSGSQIANIQSGAAVEVVSDGQAIRRTGTVAGVLNQISPVRRIFK